MTLNVSISFFEIMFNNLSTRQSGEIAACVPMRAAIRLATLFRPPAFGMLKFGISNL